MSETRLMSCFFDRTFCLSSFIFPPLPSFSYSLDIRCGALHNCDRVRALLIYRGTHTQHEPNRAAAIKIISYNDSERLSEKSPFFFFLPNHVIYYPSVVVYFLKRLLVSLFAREYLLLR